MRKLLKMLQRTGELMAWEWVGHFSTHLRPGLSTIELVGTMWQNMRKGNVSALGWGLAPSKCPAGITSQR